MLASHLVYPQLPQTGLQVVYDYPAEDAQLAQLKPGSPDTAERFEIFYSGLELANGFHELRDANEQRRRFEHDLSERKKLGRTEMRIDTGLLDALESGLPPCSGVAVGLDRTLMAIHGHATIAETMSFEPGR